MKSISHHVKKKKFKTVQDKVHSQDFVVVVVVVVIVVVVVVVVVAFFCLEKLYNKQLLTIKALDMM